MSIFDLISAPAIDDDNAYFPVISKDGRWVFFNTDAVLDDADVNEAHDHYLHDRLTGSITWVGADLGDDGRSFYRDGVISADGRFSVFGSVFDGEISSVIYDRLSGTLNRLPDSVRQDAREGDFTEDGRLVYAIEAQDIVVYDPETDARTTVVPWATISSDLGLGLNDLVMHPDASGDGSVIAFTSWNYGGGNQGGVYDTEVSVFDVDAGTNRLISIGHDGAPSDGPSWRPSLSDDGRYVAFASQATNLVEDDENGRQDAFLFDRETEALIRINLTPEGAEPMRGVENQVVVSGDGSTVLFASNDLALAGLPEDYPVPQTHFYTYDVASGALTDLGHFGNPELLTFDLSADGSIAVIADYSPFVGADDDGFRSDVYAVYTRFTDGADTVTLTSANIVRTGAGGDTVRGSSEDDWISGNGGKDRLEGARGNDTLTGGAGKDTLTGGAGNDKLKGGIHDDLLLGGVGKDKLVGNNGSDVLRGQNGWDSLDGGNGVDRLVGNKGRDLLDGGLGKDTLIGGLHADTFQFEADDMNFADVVVDYTDGVDAFSVLDDTLRSFADIGVRQKGDDVILALDGTKFAILRDTLAADIDASDFTFGVA